MGKAFKTSIQPSIAHKITTSAERLIMSFLSIGTMVVVLLMPYHAFFSTWLGTLIGPLLVFKSWKEILLMLMVAAALVAGLLRPALAKKLVKQPVIMLILLYTLLLIGLALFHQHPLASTLAGLMFDLRFLALFVVAQMILLAWPSIAEQMRHWLTIGLLVSTGLISVIGILQVTVLPPDFLSQFGYEKGVTIAPYITIDQQMHALRAFATLDGPNPFGAFLLLPLVVLTIFIVRRQYLQWTIPAFILGVVALFLTGARSAWIGAAVAAAVTGAILLGRDRLWQYVRRYGIYVAAAVVLLGVASVTYAPLRLAIFHSSPGDPSLFEGSTANHFIETANGTVDALQHPFGRGPGEAGPASFYSESPRIAENYYIQIAQEGGLLALALFVAILYLVARKLWRMASRPNAPPLTIGLLASFWGIAVVNLLLHGWADDSTALTWWGLAGLLLTQDNENYG